VSAAASGHSDLLPLRKQGWRRGRREFRTSKLIVSDRDRDHDRDREAVSYSLEMEINFLTLL
jgi:hypothetical protein